MSMGSKAASHDDTGVTRATLWHREAAATRRVTSKHVYDEVSPNDTRTCKGNNANLRQQGFMKQFEEIFNEQA